MKNPWNKASMLLESLIALSMLTLCVLFYQGATLNLLKQEQRQYEKLRGTRALYEEVREYRIHGGKLSRKLNYGNEVYHVEFTKNLRQAKVTSSQDEVVIHWHSQSFHID